MQAVILATNAAEQVPHHLINAVPVTPTSPSQSKSKLTDKRIKHAFLPTDGLSRFLESSCDCV